MKETAPTARELAAALGHKKLGRIQVCPPEERTWVSPKGDVIVFDSKHEMEQWIPLHALAVRGVYRNLRRQVKYDLHAVTVGGCKIKITSYDADYVAEDRDGKTIVFDAKGMITAMYKLKRHWMLVEYGVRIVEL